MYSSENKTYCFWCIDDSSVVSKNKHPQGSSGHCQDEVAIEFAALESRQTEVMKSMKLVIPIHFISLKTHFLILAGTALSYLVKCTFC